MLFRRRAPCFLCMIILSPFLPAKTGVARASIHSFFTCPVLPLSIFFFSSCHLTFLLLHPCRFLLLPPHNFLRTMTDSDAGRASSRRVSCTNVSGHVYARAGIRAYVSGKTGEPLFTFCKSGARHMLPSCLTLTHRRGGPRRVAQVATGQRMSREAILLQPAY